MRRLLAAALLQGLLLGLPLPAIAQPAPQTQQQQAPATSSNLPAAGDMPQPQDYEYMGPARRPKAKRVCMDDREQKAEALIRTGIILREIGRQCAKRGIDYQVEALWNAFDAANGEQILAATRLRQTALERNYPDRPRIMREFDDRLIASRGLVRMPEEECHIAHKMLSDWKDYNDLVRHSTRTELGRVKELFPRCATRNNRGDR